MAATAKYALRYPILSNAADVPADIGNLAADVDAKMVGFIIDVIANRPAAGVAGRRFYATNTGVESLDTGAAWVDLTPQTVIPIGGAMDWPWASGSIPAWALLPYGQLLTQAAYPAMQILADASARPYGGVAATNFNMPDYRGRIGVGKDDMGGTAASRITVAVSGINGATLGAVGGAEGVTLTTGQLPAHNHGVTDPGHIHSHEATIYHNNGSNGATVTTDGAFALTANLIQSSTTGITIQNAGSGSAHQNVQPTIIVNKIMRVL